MNEAKQAETPAPSLAEWGRRMAEAMNQIRIDPHELLRGALEHYNAQMDYINGRGPRPR